MNRERLEFVYNKLWDKIAKMQESEKPISFTDGIMYEWEGYKKDVFDQGNKIMAEVSWDEPGIVGSKKIFEAASKCIAIIPKGESDRQNLVDWRDASDFCVSMKVKQIEKALKLLYYDGDDRNAFTQLRMAAGNKYAVISYFFFLKDCEKYAVMRPANFQNRLAMIGESAKCTTDATWNNYQEFCRILEEVCDFLREKLPNEEITLLEAHSFLWSLWAIKDEIMVG